MSSQVIAQNRYLFSGRGEWGTSVDSKKSGSTSYGSSAMNQSYLFALQGPIMKNIQFSSSASFANWNQSYYSGLSTKYVSNRNSFSNTLFMNLKKNMSLTLKQVSNSSKNPSLNSYNSLGGILKGVILKSGPNFTLETTRTSQSYQTASGQRENINYRESLRIDKVYSNFSFETVQTLNYRRIPGTNRFITQWSARTRPIWKFSDVKRLVGSYAFNYSSNSTGHSGSLDFSSQLSKRQSYGTGLSYSYSRNKFMADSSTVYRNLGASISGSSSQYIGRNIDHSLSVRTRLLVQQKSSMTLNSNRMFGALTVSNKFQKPIGEWSLTTNYSLTLENASRAWIDIGTRNYFKVSARKERLTSTTGIDYTVEIERTELELTSHLINAEWRNVLSPELLFSTSGNAQFTRFKRAENEFSLQRRQFSFLTGLQLRMGRRSVTLSHQFQLVNTGDFKNFRNYTNSTINWPLNGMMFLEGQAQLRFESQNKMQSFNCQTNIVWPVSDMHISAIVRFQTSRSYSSNSSGGYIGIKIARNIRRAF